ncbi:MAG: methionyl-tRNA formyltransferase [Chloroflexota bacterium]
MTVSPRIVFMGSPAFAVPSLRLLAGTYRTVGVVTQPDRPSGRGRTLVPPPVKEAALELGLPLIQPEKLRQPEAMQQLREWSPDVIIVAAFGQILRQEVLDLPPFGCVNVHASLLPRWRGAAPINAAILAGDAETGITIMKMDAGVDTGPMLARRAIPIAADDTAGSLFVKLAALGGDLLLETLPGYLSGEIRPHSQPDEGATYAPMLKKEDGLLDFTRPADELARRVRAFDPWPGAYFQFNGQPLKVHAAHRAEGRGETGRRLIVQGMPAVAASDGLLILDEVQPAGKKSMPGKAFLSGARDWSET